MQDDPTIHDTDQFLFSLINMRGVSFFKLITLLITLGALGVMFWLLFK